MKLFLYICTGICFIRVLFEGCRYSFQAQDVLKKTTGKSFVIIPIFSHWLFFAKDCVNLVNFWVALVIIMYVSGEHMCAGRFFRTVLVIHMSPYPPDIAYISALSFPNVLCLWTYWLLGPFDLVSHSIERGNCFSNSYGH